jgi:hypothetical protein
MLNNAVLSIPIKKHNSVPETINLLSGLFHTEIKEQINAFPQEATYMF